MMQANSPAPAAVQSPARRSLQRIADHYMAERISARLRLQNAAYTYKLAIEHHTKVMSRRF